jgi:transcriptional regulator with AAA-type ATPase domain
MGFLRPDEREFLEPVSDLAYCNPFLPERVELERRALGPDFVEGEPVWSLQVERPAEPRANAWRICERLSALAGELRRRLAAGLRAREPELVLYEDGVLSHLYCKYFQRFLEGRFGFYREYRRDWDHYFALDGIAWPSGHDPRHAFACFHQIVRAFHYIFENIIGGSMASARLRAGVWQSIFTHDMRRYRRTLWSRMGDFATLITGPSGTGKELVARAIALSRYLPFDEGKLSFGSDPAGLFHPVNLAALAPTLVESELFGHRRGSFTGATEDRKGWLEVCPKSGTVFLDEIGDLDPGIQVKLLRVIETRQFQAVGDTASRRFEGKLIAATNRNLGEAMGHGRFREDLYYRLCSDLVTTPSLAEQLRESPDVLREMVLHLAQQAAGEEAEALAREALDWIQQNLGPAYPWPGNYRELGQCVRNILIRREYRPAEKRQPRTREEWLSGSMTADELLRRYCTLVYAETRSYEETARRLQLDRRTVKKKIDPAMLQGLK